jgi:hypothetical protein
VVGWLIAEGDGVPRDLSDLVESLRESAATHGCDALLWDAGHLLVPGLVTDDSATGTYERQLGGKRYASGAKAACLAWLTAPE